MYRDGPGAILAITLGKSSFFARSTRLLAREIARIASRQYRDSRHVAKRNGRRPFPSTSPHPFAVSQNVISAIMFTHTLPLLPSTWPPRRRSPLSLFTWLRREGGVTSNPVFSNARATRKPVLDLVALERVLDSPRFVRVLSLLYRRARLEMRRSTCPSMSLLR